ncbi:PaaI family thioesterase, partial [Priestia megaterium]|uniref:PaaI family thioesterase n=1 Tax=Priestia megaterium TaxID=1404 RepID=UPI0035B5C207
MDLPHFPNSDSPYHHHLGVTVADWQDGFARLVCDTVEHHANRSGIVHGGVLLSMLDQAAA